MHPDVEKLVAAGRLPSALGEKVSALEPGTFVAHRSWRGGKIASWDLAEDRMIIDFYNKPAHAMKLEFAAKNLEPIEEDHILARLAADTEGTQELAKKNPVAFVRAVLEVNGRSMYLDTFDEYVKEVFIPEEKFKSWWEGAKKKLRADQSFVVPSKRAEPMELRCDSVSPAEAYLADFEKVRDLKSKAKVVSNILKELGSFEAPEIELDDLVVKANESIERGTRIQLAHALELITARDELQTAVPGLKKEGQPTMEGAVSSEIERLAEVLPKLPVASQRAALAAFQGAFEDGWVDQVLGLLPTAGPRGITEITKLLLAEKKDKEILDYIKHGLQQRNLTQDLLAWACREREGVTAEVFGPALGNAVVNALEKGHYDDETPTNNRLRDLLVNDAELVPDLVKDADKGYVKTFTRRLMMTPVFEELSRRSLLARIVKVHPEMESLVSGEDDRGAHEEEEIQSTGVVVSWESLEARKAQLDEIINVRIPQNKKEINIAREYGDLRENFEYKAAKEQQAVLNRQRNELEAEIKSARGTDFSEADTSRVSVGTVVDLRDTATGEAQTFTILGAWDTDLEKGIISYLSETGDALLGHVPGDTVELPTEEAGVTRSVEVVALRGYVA